MKLKDIAQQAGVSISTVSRVLNDQHTSAASPETQERIWKIAQQGGYVPNSAARQLKSGQVFSQPIPQHTICCMLATDPLEYNNDPFYTTLTSSIRTEALRQNFVMDYYFSTPGMEQSELTALPQSNATLAQGLIIIGRFHPSILSELKPRFRNVAYVGLNSINAKVDQVVCDGYDAMQEVVRCYHEYGHHAIGFIGACDDSRLAGYKYGLEKCGLPYDPTLVVSDITLSSSGGYDGMLRLLDQADTSHPLTAVVCANDTTAIGALRACKERDIRVPEDICLMGMNDIEMLRDVSPTLSTVRVPLDEMGSTVVKLLVDRINGGHQQHVKVSFPFWIIRRESGPVEKK